MNEAPTVDPNESSENEKPEPKPEADSTDFDALENPPTPGLQELLKTPDIPSRRAMFLSLIFALVAAMNLFLLIYTLVTRPRESKKVAEAKHLNIAAPVYTADLGEFHFFLHGDRAAGADAEVRITVAIECENEAAANFVKAHIDDARDRVNTAFINTTREDFTVQTKKDLLRKLVLDRLSGLNSPGKVTQVYFSDILVE